MNGVLVQPPENLASTELKWLDRAGEERGTLAVPEGRYEKIFFSPDGLRLLAFRRDSPTTIDLWMLTIGSSQATRFTLGSQTRIGGRPVWSPDGRWVAFTSNRSGPSSIYRRSATAAADEELLYASPGMFKEVSDWTPDDRYLVFEQSDPTTSWDIWLLPLQGERKPIPYLQSRYSEIAGSVSPDGRWLAYASDATGRAEVYVRSLPVPGTEYRVSRDGGLDGYWSAGGKELIIISPGLNNDVVSVPISLTPTFHAGRPHRLFEQSPDALWLIPTPRADRFLEAVPARNAPPAGITVRLNWPAMAGR
jgi:Tol biopolymer transport system component